MNNVISSQALSTTTPRLSQSLSSLSHDALAYLIFNPNVPLTVMSLIFEMIEIKTSEECFSIAIKNVLAKRNDILEIKNTREGYFILCLLCEELKIIAKTQVTALLEMQLNDFNDIIINMYLSGKIISPKFVIISDSENNIIDFNFIMHGTHNTINIFELYNEIISGHYNHIMS